MTPFPAHVAFFVVARFSFAFAFAVDLAFAFALIAILALSFALALAVAAAFAFALAFALASALAFPFALAYVVYVHRNCFSEVIHDPRLVRVQIGLDDCSQLVVVTLKLLEFTSKWSHSFCGHSRSTTLIFTSSSSFFEERFS